MVSGCTASAPRLFRRCVSALTPFDLTFSRHLHAMVVRSEALAGHLSAARAAQEVEHLPPDMPPYQPDWLLAEAALWAAELDLNRAAAQAAQVARLAAARAQWTTALQAGHDAARYGEARAQLPQLRVAATQTDSRLAGLFVQHVEALAADDGAALDSVSAAFAGSGQVVLAVEAALSAGAAHARAGSLRAGRGDAAIAAQLGISVRTVQTHLAHAYDKLGIHGRSHLTRALS